jgi:hypothetical protein
MALVACAGLLIACQSAPKDDGAKNGQERNLETTEILALAKAACFEVVLEKPGADSLAYEKPLAWDLVDFNTRNDKYVSIGTAFAIGPDKLVTAAHVLDLCPNSLTYPKRFIREKRHEGGKTVERVYEIGDILAFSDHRDFAVFGVPGMKCGSWLSVSDSYEFGSKILTAGNAFGEGIVVREGLLLDEFPETEKGEWSFLKSSVATNPGNSGGPLMDARGRVIGIVLSRKDDFCYSLPFNQVAYGKADFHSRTALAFDVFAKRRQASFDVSYPCPLPYLRMAERWNADYDAFYVKEMEALLEENASDMFPRGANSEKALHIMENAFFPQMYLQETASGVWFSTGLNPSPTDIGNDGSLRVAEIYKDVGVYAMRLDKPAGVTVKELMDDPKKSMDLVLKGLSLKRKMSNSDEGSRILSYGQPISTERRRDRFGRPWRIDAWQLEYSDQAVMTATLPTPKGLVMLYVARSSSQLQCWRYDLPKLTDYVNFFTFGTIAQWKEFLACPDLLYGPLESVSLATPEEGGLSLKTPQLSMELGDDLFKIGPESQLYLESSVYSSDGRPVWDVRKVVVDAGNAGNSYCLAYRWTTPTDGLPQNLKDNFRNMVMNRAHPYSGKAYAEEGRMSAGSIHPDFLQDGAVKVPGDHAYTVFISKEGSADPAEAERILADFSKALTLTGK